MGTRCFTTAEHCCCRHDRPRFTFLVFSVDRYRGWLLGGLAYVHVQAMSPNLDPDGSCGRVLFA